MGKRGNGEGSITRRKDGLYMARYTVQTATGSKRKTIYGKENGKASPRSSRTRSRIGTRALLSTRVARR
jgi:integrase